MNTGKESRRTTSTGKAYVGSIFLNKLYAGISFPSKYPSNDKPEIPKNVWKISATFPGLSEIPPSSASWHFPMNWAKPSLSIHDSLP